MAQPESIVEIRRASAADAGGIAAVMAVVTAERIHSAIDRAWTADEQRRAVTLQERRAAPAAGG